MNTSDTTMPTDSHTRDDASVGNLLSRLGDDVGQLVTTEVNLAKVELRDSVNDAKTGMASFGLGAVVLFVGLLVLLLGVALLLASLTGLSPYAGYLIVGALVTAVGAILLLSAKSKLSADNLGMNRTASSLQKDQRVVKENLK